MTDAAEVAFIKSAIAERVVIAKRAAVEARAPANVNVGNGPVCNWVGKYPHLRLIHCIIDDDNIKAAYLARNNCSGDHMAVKNMAMPEVQAANAWMMFSNKWNDPDYFPVTSVKLETHSDFAQPVYCAFESVSHTQPVTAER